MTFTPLAVGMNMLTLGWMIILSRTGFVNSLLTGTGLVAEPLHLLYGWGAVIVGMVHVTFTFMVLPIEAVIRQIDPALEKAARTLGAGKLRTFWEVVLPLSLQGIAAGFLIVFLQVCGAFVLPLLMGGQGFTVVPIAIWEQITASSDRPFASTLSITLILVSLLVMILQLRVPEARTSFEHARGLGFAALCCDCWNSAAVSARNRCGRLIRPRCVYPFSGHADSARTGMSECGRTKR